ncbi:acyclic terpene utilization AtuA family protein [Candidimonas sp. SYP-B2681]|uniref:acyclic terpene utilization AtuA family protein n=1 Tax=Candidimonas sp. SYP-B2681 TaxID=2497686 RepID=UPI000F85BC8D|nr:acyclic terpene utilization AtuA family protein [Candidimonas sp. SYP-B2681]RTZ44398.1 acyclic terpene utilization AtuA family protein [Candidimonas sp. SYP-B2681]
MNPTIPTEKPLRILAATACIGYGFTEIALHRALGMGIDFIGADAGSMDPGPYYLGAGKAYVSPEAIERDLRLLLVASRRHDIPLIIGSAGGSGGNPHLQATREIVERIIQQERLDARLAVIGAEPPRDLIAQRLAAHRIHDLWPPVPLDESTIVHSERIVAMMGVEPLQEALRQGANVVLAGRCSDSAIYAAIPLMLGYDPALAWHLGKTIECGATIASPKTGQDCIIGTLGADYFTVEPGHPAKRCTPTKVAAHTMYENPSPYEFIEPSGIVSTKLCTYEALDDRIVKVQGTTFSHAARYTVKLEGVMHAGWRAVMFAGIRDPILISQIVPFTEQIQERTRAEAQALGIEPSQYSLTIRRYGLDAVSVIPSPRRGRCPTKSG